ncbi:MAG TPA: ATP-binding protein, partial [Spirochaetia bacterium]
ELASERSRSTTIISAMTDGILVINMDRLVVLRNNAAARILPDCAALDPPFPLDSIASPDVREIIGVVLDAPGGFMILSRQIPLGSFTYMVNVSPIIEPNGDTSGAVAAFNDVTALAKLDTAKSSFVSLVAHEVKSPLAATEGWLNLVLSGQLESDPAQERAMLSRALVRVRTLRSLVSELLSLTSIQTGNFSLKRVPVDVVVVIAEVVDASREKAAARGISLTVEPACGDMRVLADRDALDMIYGNLVENAVKYSKDNGHVRVRTVRDGIYVAVSVIDDGIGIAAEDIPKLFAEFSRIRNEQTAAIPGTGLGLSLVKRLAELHEGTVAVCSTLGAGSEFTVRIPALP